jgi:hypothetical protein
MAQTAENLFNGPTKGYSIPILKDTESRSTPPESSDEEPMVDMSIAEQDSPASISDRPDLMNLSPNDQLTLAMAILNPDDSPLPESLIELISNLRGRMRSI